MPRLQRAAGQHGQIAAIGVDVEIVRGTGGRWRSSRHPLPVWTGVASVGDDALELEHCRVGREEEELAARFRELQAAVERSRDCPVTSILCSSRPPYANRKPSSAARESPDTTRRSRRAARGSEVDIPDPGDVAPVGDAVVQGHDRHGGPAALYDRSVASHLRRRGSSRAASRATSPRSQCARTGRKPPTPGRGPRQSPPGRIPAPARAMPAASAL